MEENKDNQGTPPPAADAEGAKGAAGATPDPTKDANNNDALINEGKPKEGDGASTPDPWDADDWPKLVPQKFKTEEGKINEKALAKSYMHLEKRFGSGDVPPEKPEDYKIEVQFPDGAIDPERDKSFRKACHAKRMTNEHVQFVYEQMAGFVKEGMALDKNNKEAARKDLRDEWGEDNYDSNIKDAYKAFNAFADDKDRASIKEIGNNPPVLRLLAKIGREIKEDTPPIFAAGQSEDDIKVLMKSEAYWNPKHPEHDVAKKKAEEFYKRSSKKGKA